jgi:hypothetical protein
MTNRAGSLQSVLLAILILDVCLTPIRCAYGSGHAPNSPNERQQTVLLLDVRKVLRNQYASRFPQIHYYILYISLRISDQTYCSEYETPVLQEIEDVTSAQGKSVEVKLKGKIIIIRTPKGRRLKTHLTERKQC